MHGEFEADGRTFLTRARCCTILLLWLVPALWLSHRVPMQHNTLLSFPCLALPRRLQNCKDVKSATHFKRRYGVLTARGLFLYRYHDDDADAIVKRLDVTELEKGSLFGRRLPCKSKDHVYWRLYVDCLNKGGYKSKEQSERLSVVCRGTERMYQLWMEAVNVSKRSDC